MLELYALRNAQPMSKDYDRLTKTQKNFYNIISRTGSLIYLIILIIALVKASKTQNKPLHMLFALVSPFWYLVFSIFVEDF
jgi:hypothetical protein